MIWLVLDLQLRNDLVSPRSTIAQSGTGESLEIAEGKALQKIPRRQKTKCRSGSYVRDTTSLRHV